MDDLISRKALLEAFGADVQHLQCWDTDLYSLLVAEIEDAPAVEAEPVRHGRWDGDTCTNCKLPWNDLMCQNADDWGYFDPMPPFCPNCGAKMDLEVRP